VLACSLPAKSTTAQRILADDVDGAPSGRPRVISITFGRRARAQNVRAEIVEPWV
jgi:hypothetical protein